MTGDMDLAALGSVLAEPARARILLALGDGRALPASVLASEAGVAASTASAHLARLLEAGLLTVTPQGRHRYFRLAGPQVAEMLEVLGRVAPAAPVRSLREGTRAAALRAARTCYDHLAGRLGVAVMDALIADGAITGGDGRHRSGGRDRLSARGQDVDYRLTGRGADRLDAIGVAVGDPGAEGLPLRYCVDWTEQAHHLSGPVGRALADRLFALGWLERAPRSRAVHLTVAGAQELPRRLGVALEAAPPPRGTRTAPRRGAAASL